MVGGGNLPLPNAGEGGPLGPGEGGLHFVALLQLLNYPLLS